MTESNINTQAPILSTRQLSWRITAARQRCENPKAEMYRWYGARGIRACTAFTVPTVIRLIGFPPRTKQLDRKDNNGNYSCGECAECKENGWPLNIQWVTPVANARNASSNINVEHLGKTQCVSAWVEELGLNINTVRYRIRKGMDPLDAITKPVSKLRAPKVVRR